MRPTAKEWEGTNKNKDHLLVCRKPDKSKQLRNHYWAILENKIEGGVNRFEAVGNNII